MSITPQEIRTHVRAYLDLEPEDLPDTLIDQWTKEGQFKIYRHRTWPGAETSTQLTSVADTSEYSLPVKEVTQITGPHGSLRRMEAAEAERYFDAGRTSTTSEPRAFSVWGNSVRLWPTPSGAFTYTVRGIKVPRTPFSSGLGAGDPVDLPTSDAQFPLLSWVMHRALVHQDEPEMAMSYKESFDSELERLVHNETQVTTYGPVVMNSHRGPSHLPPEVPVTWGV